MNHKITTLLDGGVHLDRGLTLTSTLHPISTFTVTASKVVGMVEPMTHQVSFVTDECNAAFVLPMLTTPRAASIQTPYDDSIQEPALRFTPDCDDLTKLLPESEWPALFFAPMVSPIVCPVDENEPFFKEVSAEPTYRLHLDMSNEEASLQYYQLVASLFSQWLIALDVKMFDEPKRSQHIQRLSVALAVLLKDVLSPEERAALIGMEKHRKTVQRLVWAIRDALSNSGHADKLFVTLSCDAYIGFF